MRRFPGPGFGRGQRTQAPKRRKRVTTEGHLPWFSRESFVPNSMALGPCACLSSPFLQSCCSSGSHTSLTLVPKPMESDGRPPEGAANSGSSRCLPRLLELGALDQAVGQSSGKARRAGLLPPRPCPLSSPLTNTTYSITLGVSLPSHAADLALGEVRGGLLSQAQPPRLLRAAAGLSVVALGSSLICLK